MGKPLTDDEKKVLSQFLRGVMKGTVDLGWSAMPMIALYSRAQEHNTSLVAILAADGEMMLDIANAMKSRAARLPASVIQVLKHVILAAETEQSRPTVGSDRESSRAAPDGTHGGETLDDDDV